MLQELAGYSLAVLPPTDAEVQDLLEALRRGMKSHHLAALDAFGRDVDDAVNRGELERRAALEGLVCYALTLRNDTLH